jgi:TRAP-type mannitol/chloroaromatic compound transport system permease small subunit
MLPIMVLLTVLSFRFALASWQINEWSNSAGGLVVWPAKAILPIGFALLALQSVSELIKRAAMLRGAARFDTAYEKPLQ